MNQYIDYNQIRYTAPYHLKKQKTPRKLKFWQCLLFFGCLMLGCDFLVTLFYYFVPDELAATILQQLIFLASSVLFVKAMGASLREVFPIRKPATEGVWGVCILAIGSVLAANIISVWTVFLAPEQYTAISDSMDHMFPNVFLEFLTVVVLPPFCEEALHRGVLFSGCRNSFRNRFVIVAVSGFLFGIFHIYPVRWAAPMLLGWIMAWVMLQTNNMVYTSLLHAMYNAILLVASLAAELFTGSLFTGSGALGSLAGQGSVLAAAAREAGSDVMTQTVTVSRWEVGSLTIFYGIFVPALLYTGFWLIRRAVEPVKPDFIETGKERLRLLQIFVPTIIIILIGIFMLIAGTIQ